MSGNLLWISDNIGDDNLNALKFIFKDLLPRSKLTKVDHGIDLFTLLEEWRLISEADTSLLKEALNKIGRKDLASKLKTGPTARVISPFRLLLYDIAVDMCPTQTLPKAKYYFDIPKGKSDRIQDTFDLFSLLEQDAVFTEEDTSKLQECLKSLSRNDLAGRLENFTPAGVPRRHSERQDLQRDGIINSKTTDIEPDSSTTSSALSTMFAGALGKPCADKERLIDLQKLLDAAKSVGLIGRNGTGFVVGGGCIMTAAHVLKDAFAIPIDKVQGYGEDDYMIDVQDRLHHQGLCIIFTFCSPPRQVWLRTVKYMNIDLDTAVIEVKNWSDLPPPFNTLLDVPNDRFQFDLLGHDEAGWDQIRDRKCYTITRREDFQKMKKYLAQTNIDPAHLNEYDKFGKNGSFVEFHCSMKNGASGSPGVVVWQDRVCVFTMLKAGYPLNPLNVTLPEELCVEQGVRMRAIKDHMKSVQPQLGFAIFGDW